MTIPKGILRYIRLVLLFYVITFGITGSKKYMNREIKRILIKLSLLLSIVLIAIIASCCGFTEEKFISLVNDAKSFAIEAKDSINPPTATTITPTVITPILSTTNAPSINTATIKEPEITLLNPSWTELKDFLLQDKTDMIAYDYPNFVCGDFAKTLKQQANKAGWRCAYVGIKLSGYPDFNNYGIPSNTGHALNAFETTDKGLVYIDCTGVSIKGSNNCDKLVNLKITDEYIPTRIFPEQGWNNEWKSMGVVTSIGSLKW